jgi:hypothetical protein
MSFLPQLFYSHINSKGGPAKSNRFQVIIPVPAYISRFVENSVIERLFNLPTTVFSEITSSIAGTGILDANPQLTRYLALQCESASLPGKTLQTADVQIYGPGFKVPYMANYGELSLTFICTNDFYERKLFDRWMEAIIPLDTHNPRFPKGSQSTYLTNIQVIQYNDFIKQIYAVECVDCFPIGISPQQVSWGDDGFHRLTVTMAYQKQKTIYNGTVDYTSLATTLLSSYLAGTPVSDALKAQVKGFSATLQKLF